MEENNSSRINEDSTIYDILGIGFGPANLSISVVLAEMNLEANHTKRRLRSCFLESHDRFRWHPGMMIPGTRMQISFLKDLATFRNPSSPFTFLNYLHSHNRLASFVNRSTFTPTRREFSDYLTWASNQVIDKPNSSTNVFVKYDQKVINVEPIPNSKNGNIDLLKVISISSNQQISFKFCRNLIISTGGSPSIPFPFPQTYHHRIIHTSQYLDRIDQVLSDLITNPIQNPSSNLNSSFNSIHTTSESDSDQSNSSRLSSLPTTPENETNLIENSIKLKIAVIGAGQSATETLLETYSKLNQLKIQFELDLIIRKGNLYPSDDSGFSNQIFDPISTDLFYSLGNYHQNPKNQIQNPREIILNQSKSTNYGVVNPETLKSLYETIYAQKVEEDILIENQKSNLKTKLQIINHSIIKEIKLNSLKLMIQNVLTNELNEKSYDLIILGTGYKRESWKEILFLNSLNPIKKNNLLNLFLNSQQQPQEEQKENEEENEEENDKDIKNQIELINSFNVLRNYKLNLPNQFFQIEKNNQPNLLSFNPTIWLQGCNELTHGIGDSLLSNLAVRSGEVINGILNEGWFEN